LILIRPPRLGRRGRGHQEIVLPFAVVRGKRGEEKGVLTGAPFAALAATFFLPPKENFIDTVLLPWKAAAELKRRAVNTSFMVQCF